MSVLRLIQQCAEFQDRARIANIPKGTRGIYALLRKRKDHRGVDKYDVVYIGMSRRGILSRLRSHDRSAKKAGLWSHFSVYSVWPNITDEEIGELEGLFRAIYRKDSQANRIAVQKGFKRLIDVRENNFKKWG